LWADLSDQIYDFLNGISLAKVVEKRAKEASQEVAARQEKSGRRVKRQIK
jgi:DNA-binding IscR family transcriptional regulator